ncbi:hypothetical protein [Hydrogenophaga laconesensis]|uniref:hypothetical protein n=1 Tax=Hydrogenophaga laconesensis TaxID=1805971 RepID=UPI00286C805C|nr:hypothetical protein [Hydrogenophaga laconesensis]
MALHHRAAKSGCKLPAIDSVAMVLVHAGHSSLNPRGVLANREAHRCIWNLLRGCMAVPMLPHLQPQQVAMSAGVCIDFFNNGSPEHEQKAKALQRAETANTSSKRCALFTGVARYLVGKKSN